MNDDIIQKIINFRDQREWGQFHNIKDLPISILIESSELLECFQWKNQEQANGLINSPDRIRIEEEMADIGIYLLPLCDKMNVSLETIIENRLVKSEQKYPVSKSKGNAIKYDRL